jgi:hypothetical protein
MDRMLLRVVLVRAHPVILSELRLVVPVMDAGFWVVERRSGVTRYRERQLDSRSRSSSGFNLRLAAG